MQMKRIALLTAGGFVLSAATAASAGTVSFSPNLEDWGGDDPDGSGGASAAVIWEESFTLPSLISIDSASFDLAHSYMSDVDLRLTAPDGSEFIFAEGNSATADDGFDGGFDGADLGDGGSVLGGVETYTFAETGDTWNDGSFSGPDPIPSGTYASVAWHSGPFTAGEWTVTLTDAWDSVDDGALGDVSIAYTVPAPGALALIGVAGVVGGRRRRRQD